MLSVASELQADKSDLTRLLLSIRSIMLIKNCRFCFVKTRSGKAYTWSGHCSGLRRRIA